jgi:hypothetical protein
MKPYVKLYMDYFGYDTSDTILCEVCGAVAVDINHIDARGLGGNPKGDKDDISNLQACCRACHIKYADKKQWKDWLKKIHKIKMDTHGKRNKQSNND